MRQNVNLSDSIYKIQKFKNVLLCKIHFKLFKVFDSVYSNLLYKYFCIVCVCNNLQLEHLIMTVKIYPFVASTFPSLYVVSVVVLLPDHTFCFIQPCFKRIY